ncbi:MAG: hypothetical protein M1816_003439 [Peltula sp. TS41687]|nr:MAG: hypothetical protein M1816_003439 [Peltula sp. TS41687]
MTPFEFLLSSPVEKTVKRKLGYVLSNEDKQNLRYDLAPYPTDTIVLDMHDRQSQLNEPERKKMRVLLEQYFLSRMIDKLTTLEAKFTLAKSIQVEDVVTLGLSTQYFDLIKKTSEYVRQRNETAHETANAFAQFLKDNIDYEQKYGPFWARLYPILYGKCLDDAAAAMELEDDGSPF